MNFIYSSCRKELKMEYFQEEKYDTMFLVLRVIRFGQLHADKNTQQWQMC